MVSSLSFKRTVTAMPITVVLVFSSFINLVGAYSFMAGHCDPGDLSNKGYSGHGTSGSGSLANGSMQVRFDAVTLSTSSVTSLDPNTEYTVTLNSSASDIRGFLLRLSGVNGESADGVLIKGSDGNVESLSGCSAGISGLSHNSKSDKSSVSFTFDYSGSAGAEFLLEVTVVKSRTQNAWYYSAFELAIADDNPSPTKAPISPSSTPAPVTFTSSPVASTQTPSESPTKSTQTPSESPTKSSGYRRQFSPSVQALVGGSATIFAVLFLQ